MFLHYLFSFVIILFTFSCAKEKKSAFVTSPACRGEPLEQVEKESKNEKKTSCRGQINEQLSLKNVQDEKTSTILLDHQRITNAVPGKSMDQFSLLMAFTQGKSLTLDSFNKAKIYVHTTEDGIFTLGPNEWSIEKKNLSADKIVSLGVLQDYSASFDDEEIKVQTEIFRDFFKIFKGTSKIRTDYVAFSDSAYSIWPFSDDMSLWDGLSESIKEIPRTNCSFYDSLNKSIDLMNASESNSDMKLMLISLDGKDNASLSAKPDLLVDKLKKNHIIPIIFATYLTDNSELKLMAKNTGGNFYYAPSTSQMKAYLKNILPQFEQNYLFSITRDFGGTIDHIWIDINSSSDGMKRFVLNLK